VSNIDECVAVFNSNAQKVYAEHLMTYQVKKFIYMGGPQLDSVASCLMEALVRDLRSEMARILNGFESQPGEYNGLCDQLIDSYDHYISSFGKAIKEFDGINA
jgi:hypothetical protein